MHRMFFQAVFVQPMSPAISIASNHSFGFRPMADFRVPALCHVAWARKCGI